MSGGFWSGQVRSGMDYYIRSAQMSDLTNPKYKSGDKVIICTTGKPVVAYISAPAYVDIAHDHEWRYNLQRGEHDRRQSDARPMLESDLRPFDEFARTILSAWEEITESQGRLWLIGDRLNAMLRDGGVTPEPMASINATHASLQERLSDALFDVSMQRPAVGAPSKVKECVEVAE